MAAEAALEKTLEALAEASAGRAAEHMRDTPERTTLPTPIDDNTFQSIRKLMGDTAAQNGSPVCRFFMF